MMHYFCCEYIHYLIVSGYRIHFLIICRIVSLDEIYHQSEKKFPEKRLRKESWPSMSLTNWRFWIISRKIRSQFIIQVEFTTFIDRSFYSCGNPKILAYLTKILLQFYLLKQGMSGGISVQVLMLTPLETQIERLLNLNLLLGPTGGVMKASQCCKGYMVQHGRLQNS